VDIVFRGDVAVSIAFKSRGNVPGSSKSGARNPVDWYFRVFFRYSRTIAKRRRSPRMNLEELLARLLDATSGDGSVHVDRFTLKSRRMIVQHNADS